MKGRGFIFAFLPLLLTTCIDPFDIGDVVNGQPRLVVDGLLTNQPQAHEVRISYSSPTLNTFDREVVSGADVFIEDENGSQVSLIEDTEREGVYLTPSNFAGTVGVTYTLRVRTAENVSYRSLPEMMRPVAEIDSIYAELDSRQSLSSLGTLLNNWGMQFYVSTGTGTPESNFYQWKWEETYQFTAPLAREDQIIQPICYQSGRQFNQLLIGSSQDFSQDRIGRQPITFVSKNTYKLQQRYSLLVKQLSLSERAFNFWSDVEVQRDTDGSLFDPPPSQIIGNMVRDDDPEDIVLGYFQVSAVTEQRFFITRAEVPASPGGPIGGFSSCVESSEPPADGNNGESSGGPDDGPPDFCYDCTLIQGTTTERPSFW
ncbi:DUF4249 domain-containing protein [Tunicatimonas pelagia]|uniref:DUF4249 domain-containing protein n=1 Tax=Tunicatimonas pelagia TaxID=931531 RepID=UPI0026668AAF|nr:DUF4249 domain-containing protein [Tunicatimonas pelagia]WKN45630.1 DUF4249 domain-containing protein [Tunicatimonas pelagia]